MKFSFNWLKEYVDIPCSPEALGDRLTLAGHEVDSVSMIGSAVSGIITGKILEISPHPNADRLVITRIDDGTAAHRIVTGAKNVAVGDVVPVAVPGSVLANGTTLKAAQLRGVDSNGMLCSESELGLAETVPGIWILPPDTPLGADFASLAHVKDAILDISVLPNRGDCVSVWGMAREISAIFELPLRAPGCVPPQAAGKGGTPISIDVNDTAGCPLYTARVIRGLRGGASPIWMQRRLQLSGIRPISLAVDITNYVLLELGQPLHAFALGGASSGPEDGVLGGEGVLRVVVRGASFEEGFTALDGQTRRLLESDLVIANSMGVLALAGVMGGEASGVSDTCSDIVLEAAYFDPVRVRKTAQRLALRTESAIRFERGVDPEGVVRASDRAAVLYHELGGGLPDGPVHQASSDSFSTQHTRYIPFDPAAVNRLLGTAYSEEAMASALTRLGFQCEGREVGVPSWRIRDVTGLADLGEEIARIIGYETIPSVFSIPAISPTPPSTLQKLRTVYQDMLTGFGCFQVCTYPMVSESDIHAMGVALAHVFEIRNPLSPSEQLMRSHLLPSLLKVVRHHAHHQLPTVRLFEFGKSYSPTPAGSDEPEWLGVAITGSVTPVSFSQNGKNAEAVSFVYLKGIVEILLDQVGQLGATGFSRSSQGYLHPGQQADIQINGSGIGHVGFVHPLTVSQYDMDQPIGVILLNVSALCAAIEAKAPVLFQPFSRFPTTRRDMAFLAPNSLSYSDIQAGIQQLKSEWVTEVALFDIFESEKIGADMKSMAVSLTYQHPDRTLSMEEVNTADQALRKALSAQLPIQFR